MFTILCGLMMLTFWKDKDNELLAPIIVMLTVTVIFFASFADIGLVLLLLI